MRSSLLVFLLILPPAALPAAAQQVGHSGSGLTSANPESAGSFPQELQNQGQMTYSIPLEVNASRGDKVTPRLALSYSSNAPQGPLGAGWSLGLTYVELDFMGRTPDGPDALGADGRFVQERFVFVEAGEKRSLVEWSPGEYRAAVESRFLVFTQQGDVWEALDGAGTRYVFRIRQTDLEDRSVRWYLSEVIDGNGNWARYVYRWPIVGFVFPGQPPPPPEPPTFGKSGDTAVVPLLFGVIWNGNAELTLDEADAASAKDQLHFLYEERPDRQIVGGHGTITQTTVRLKEVRVVSRDHKGQLRRVRTYHLTYRQSPSNQGSLLETVQVSGAYCETAPAECPRGAALPATTFDYSSGIVSVGAGTETLRAASGAMPDHMGFQVIDLLPEDEDDHLLGGASLTRGGAIDINGDGRRDVVTVDYREPPVSSDFEFDWHVWSNRAGDPGRAVDVPFNGRLAWETKINEVPAKDFSDLIDLNGDGRPDLVRQGWQVHWNHGTSFDDATTAWDPGGAGSAPIDCPRPFDRSDSTLRRNAEEGLSHMVRLCAVRDLTGDGIPDSIQTDTGDPDLWHVYPGYLEGGEPAWPPRGGFSRHPIPWKIARDTFPGTDLFVHQGRSWGHGADRGPRDSTRQAGDSYTESMLADFNGDGLPDLLPRPFQSNGFGKSSLSVLLNTGRGFREIYLDIPEAVFAAYPHRFVYPSKTESSSESAPIYQTQGLLDVNGDGLADLLLYQPGDQEALLVSFGTGSGFRAPGNWLTGTQLLRGLSIARWDRAGVHQLQRRGFLDVDGDGRLDFVQEARAAGWTALLGPARPPLFSLRNTTAPDRLIEIRNGIGGSLETTYRPSTAWGQGHLPFVLDLVSRLDPAVRAQQSSTTAPPVSPTSFSYEDGRLWRHPETGLWEYRGYARLTQSRDGGNSSTTSYAVAEPVLAGRPESRELRNTLGCRFQRMANTWVIHNAPGGVRIPYLGKQEETHTNGTTCIASSARSQLREILSADDFGHALVQLDRGTSSGSEDDVYTLTDHAIGPAGRPLDLAWRVRVCRDAACKAALSEVRYAYDGNLADERSALPLGQAGAGGNLKLLTQVNYDLSDPSKAPEILELKRHTYGFRGNLASSVVLHDATEGTRTTIDYDARFQLLPVTTTTGLQAAGGTRPAAPFTTLRTYDVTLGVATTETDPNGHVTTYTPDPFGRVVKVEITRGANREVVSDKEYFYDDRGAEEVSRTYHNAVRFDEERSRFDGLGRLLRTWSPLGADVGNRLMVKKEIVYDALGRPLIRYEPGQDGSPSRLARYFFYDPQGRVETEVLTRPRSGVTGTERTDMATDTWVTRHTYSLGTSGWTTSTRDANATGSVVPGPASREVRDLRGRLVETADRAGNRTLFRYDPLGNLDKVTRFLDPPEDCTAPCPAPVPVELTMGHDSLGRTLWTNDPDKGVVRVTHDRAGRQLRVETADVRTPTVFDRGLSYEYDLLGRLIRKRGLRKIGGVWGWDNTVDATFQYDQPAAGTPHPRPTNLLGRLASFTDATGTTFFGYDAQGRNTNLVKDFFGLPAGQRRFEVKHEHSRSGRVAAVDNGVERLEYFYNTAGWLRNASDFGVSYWNVQSFDEIGLPTYVLRADSMIAEEFAYDPETHRLDLHRAVGSNPAAGPLLQLSYSEYDPMGHLLEMFDVRSQTDYTFRYDALYRLRTASAFNMANGTGTPYDLLYLYDSLSNVREERDAATSGGKIFGYRNDGRQPHAALSVTARIQGSPSLFPATLTYAYGNLLNTEQCVGFGGPLSGPLTQRCFTVRSFEYSAEDRLIRSAEGGQVTTYGWDAQGERAWQRLERPDGSRTTVYSLGRFLDVIVDQAPDGQIQTAYERHLYAGAQRIATRRNLQGSSDVTERHYLWDHLGSVRAVADGFGDLLAHRDYLPFGKAAPMAAGGGRFGFTGQEEGLGDGLYLLGPRAYDPGLLRFLSPDPQIPEPGTSIGYNRYAYAFNNPVNLVDPSGHSPLFAIVGLFIATVGLVEDLGDAIGSGDTDAALIAIGSFGVKAIATAVGQAAGAALYDDIISTVGGGAINEAVATGVEFAVASAFSTLGQELASGKPELGSLLKNVGLSAAGGLIVGSFVGGIRADLLGVDVTHDKEVQSQLARLQSFYRDQGVDVDFSGVTVRQGGLVISWIKPAAAGFAAWDTITLSGDIPLDAARYKLYSTLAHELGHVAQMADDFFMPVRYLLYHSTFEHYRIPYEAQAFQWEAAYVACRAAGTCQ